MATKEAKPAPEGEEAAPRKSKKLLIIIVAAVVLIGLIGGAAFFVLKSKKHAEDGDEEETAEVTKKAEKKKDAHPPIFVTLEPFTVNLQQETGDQYLQISLAVELEEAAAEQAIKATMPKIRNSITMLLSTKKASELAPREGKEKLAQELKEAINEVLSPDAHEAPKKGKKKAAEPEGPAKAVLFTAFIIQ